MNPTPEGDGQSQPDLMIDDAATTYVAPTEEERREFFRESGMTNGEINYLLMIPPMTSRQCPVCHTWSGGALSNVAQHNLSCYAPSRPKPGRAQHPYGSWPEK